MIQSFACEDTEGLFNRRRSRRFVQIGRVAQRELEMLNAALRLDDLRSPPGNRLELLRGNRAGQYSIRINDQWCICFEWLDGDAFDVEIVDYH